MSASSQLNGGRCHVKPFEVRFVAAVDGATGLQMAVSLRPDLVLLDMQLPDIDGMHVLQRLRAHPDLRDTPVIVLSANAMPRRSRWRAATARPTTGRSRSTSRASCRASRARWARA